MRALEDNLCSLVIAVNFHLLTSFFLIVILQPLDHEPAPGTKCRDKFLVQSTELKPELQGMDIADIVCDKRYTYIYFFNTCHT